MEKGTIMDVDGKGHMHEGLWRGSQTWRLMERVTWMEVGGEGHMHRS